VELKTRHHAVPITPYRSTSLLRRDVTQTHIVGKAYTLPRRQHQQPSSPLRSFAGYSPAGAATPPLAGTRVVTAGDGAGLTVWLGDEDVNVDERLSPATARCTCTLRRVVATRPPADADAAVLRGLTPADTPTSFTTFKPASMAIAADVVRASPLARSSVTDCGAFYDRPLVNSHRDDTGEVAECDPQRRDRPIK